VSNVKANIGDLTVLANLGAKKCTFVDKLIKIVHKCGRNAHLNEVTAGRPLPETHIFLQIANFDFAVIKIVLLLRPVHL